MNSSSNNKRTRIANHAGSWYSEDARTLSGQLSKWLQEANTAAEKNQPARAIICPHAGYSYSGPTAAYSFKHLQAALADVVVEKAGAPLRRIFILGPSHHHYTRGCELTQNTIYATPVGNLRIDTAVIQELFKSGLFEWMDADVDEAEHSIEMQLPYIAQILNGRDIPVVPILVGNLSFEKEAQYGRLLAPLFKDPSNFFVISSDFCHWGKRFDYTYYDKAKGAIWQSIEDLDKQGTRLIEEQDPKKFNEYLVQYRNTICGRHPIGVLLQMMDASNVKHEVATLHYAQSSKCASGGDSSVSYVAAVVVRLLPN